MGRNKHKSSKASRHHAQIKKQKGVDVEKKKKPGQQQRSWKAPWKEIAEEYGKVYPGCGISEWKPPKIPFVPENLPPFPILASAQVETWPLEDARKRHVSFDEDCLDAAASAGKCRIKRLLYGFNKGNVGSEMIDYIDQLLSDSALSFIALAYRFRQHKRRKVPSKKDRNPLERQKHLARRFLSYCFSVNEAKSLAIWIGQLFSPQLFPDFESKRSAVFDTAFTDCQIQLIWQTGHELGAGKMRIAFDSECSEWFRSRQRCAERTTLKARSANTVASIALPRPSESFEVSGNEDEGDADAEERIHGDDERDIKNESGDDDEEDEVMIVEDNSEARSASIATSPHHSIPSPTPLDALRNDVVLSTRAMLNLSSHLLDQNSLSTEESQVFSTWLSTVSTVTAALSYKAPTLTSGGGAARQSSSSNTANREAYFPSLEFKRERGC